MSEYYGGVTQFNTLQHSASFIPNQTSVIKQKHQQKQPSGSILNNIHDLQINRKHTTSGLLARAGVVLPDQAREVRRNKTRVVQISKRTVMNKAVKPLQRFKHIENNLQYASSKVTSETRQSIGINKQRTVNVANDLQK